MEDHVSAAITAAITDHFKRTAQAAVVQEVLHRFKVEEKFHANDLYWKDDVRGSRFESTFKTGILYRPPIVADLIQKIENVLSEKVKKGVMVKGPAGIGKSHSIVNLVLKLMYGSNNQYLVTFIPDCEAWTSVYYLLEMICKSCGVSIRLIERRVSGNNTLDGMLLQNFVETIDEQLKLMGKKWIFVFDQINKLFVKGDNILARDASGLAFPYNCITNIRKASRITSVISASANNEMAYKERHEGFLEYLHSNRMTTDELLVWSDFINNDNVDTFLSATWGVPLFTFYLIEDELDMESYERRVIEDVRNSLRTLRGGNTHHWNEIVGSTISSLLLVDTKEDRYDKKFLLKKQLNVIKNRYSPLVPQVLTGYRSYIWEELMEYAEKQERNLLTVCEDRSTTNKVRGCHFETMVIRRCCTMDIEFIVGFETVVVPSDQNNEGFGGKVLPNTPLSDGLHFPFDPNFPAIDFFLKRGRYVFAIQVHVSSHDDVAHAFIGLCNQAGWFQKFDHIELIYLSPEEAVTNLVASLVNPPRTEAVLTRQDETPCQIHRRAISKDFFPCLQSLRWPDGCSLQST